MGQTVSGMPPVGPDRLADRRQLRSGPLIQFRQQVLLELLKAWPVIRVITMGPDPAFVAPSQGDIQEVAAEVCGENDFLFLIFHRQTNVMNRNWIHCWLHRGTIQLLSTGDILVLIRTCPPGRDNNRFELRSWDHFLHKKIPAQCRDNKE